MAPCKKAVKKVNTKAASTDITESVLPLNNDGSGNPPKPDMRSEINLQMILVEKENCLEIRQGQHAMLTFELNVKCSKNKALERDHASFKATSCDTFANQEAVSLNLTIATLKANAKTTEKSKQDMLKSKDVKYKDTFTLY
jgi:hypothetical protein